MPRRTYWEDRFEDRPVRTLIQLTLGLLAGCAVVGLVGWGAYVAFSGVKGQGDSVVKKNSADNFISAQAAFVRDNQTYQTYLQQIRDAKKAVTDFEAQHPNLGNGSPYDPLTEQDANLRTTLTGLTQQCQNTVTDYNTRSASYLTQDFKNADLPTSLDPAACSTGAQ